MQVELGFHLCTLPLQILLFSSFPKPMLRLWLPQKLVSKQWLPNAHFLYEYWSPPALPYKLLPVRLTHCLVHVHCVYIRFICCKGKWVRERSLNQIFFMALIAIKYLLTSNKALFNTLPQMLRAFVPLWPFDWVCVVWVCEGSFVIFRAVAGRHDRCFCVWVIFLFNTQGYLK